MGDKEGGSWCDSGSDWSTSSCHNVKKSINSDFIRFMFTCHIHLKRPTARRVATPLVRQKKPGLRRQLEEALQIGLEGVSVSPSLLDRIVTSIAQQTDHVFVAALIVHHLSDPENDDLRQDVLLNRISPETLVSMPESELVNPKLRAKWEKQRSETLQQKTVMFVEQLHSGVTSLFMCPSCGGNDCILRHRLVDTQKWAADNSTPYLLTCCACSHVFRK